MILSLGGLRYGLSNEGELAWRLKIIPYINLSAYEERCANLLQIWIQSNLSFSGLWSSPQIIKICLSLMKMNCLVCIQLIDS